MEKDKKNSFFYCWIQKIKMTKDKLYDSKKLSKRLFRTSPERKTFLRTYIKPKKVTF